MNIPWQRLPMVASLLSGFASFLLAVVLGDLLADLSTMWKVVLLVSSLLLFGGAAFVLMRLPRTVIVKILPSTYSSQAEKDSYARRGFIGFVPLAPERWDAEPDDEHLIAGFADPRSNFYPISESIRSHRRRLTHCWLLWKPGQQRDRQRRAARLLVTALQRELPNCHFAWEPYEIIDENEVEVVKKTHWLVEQVLAEAHRLPNPIRASDIIADISTGVRSMILGMTLACLHEDHDLSFMSTKYDGQNHPTGELVATAYHFEPVLQHTKDIG